MPTVLDILRTSAEKWPDKIALYDKHGSLSFRELLKSAEELSGKLKEKGIGKDLGLSVQARNSREFVIGLFAACGTGAAVMPLSHGLKEREIEEIKREAGIHYILHEKQIIREASENIALSLSEDMFLFRTVIPLNKSIAPHVPDAAFIRFTSGTTGKAKGVVLSYSSVLDRVEGAKRALSLEKDDVVIWVLPMAYHFIASIVLYVYTGATLVIAENFMAPTVLEAIKKYKGSMLYASPMHLRILAADKTGMGMGEMKNVISTSTAISKDICLSFYERYGIPVVQAYGIIEIGLPIINIESALEFPESVGKAVPGYETALVNEEGEAVAPGQTGILAIRGPGMFDAYLNPPVMREEVLMNGYFLTADYADKNEAGLLVIQGRKKSAINVSGNKVFPEEVEALINTLPQIKESRISGVPHPVMGQIVQAEIVLENDSTIDEEELISFCRKHLSSYKIPQRVVKVEQLQMTDSGKIVR